MHESPVGTFETCRAGLTMSVVRGRPEVAFRGRQAAFDPSVWTGRALQAEFEKWRVLVLRICIRPLDGAFVLLAIMDIRAHPISFSERP